MVSLMLQLYHIEYALTFELLIVFIKSILVISSMNLENVSLVAVFSKNNSMKSSCGIVETILSRYLTMPPVLVVLPVKEIMEIKIGKQKNQ